MASFEMFKCNCDCYSQPDATHALECELWDCWEYRECLVDWDPTNHRLFVAADASTLATIETLEESANTPVALPAAPINHECKSCCWDPVACPVECQCMYCLYYDEEGAYPTEPTDPAPATQPAAPTAECNCNSAKHNNVHLKSCPLFPVGGYSWGEWAGGSSYSSGMGNTTVSTYKKCRHYQQPFTLPNGLVVYPSSSRYDTKDDQFIPDLGVYLDGCWKPECRAYHISKTYRHQTRH